MWGTQGCARNFTNLPGGRLARLDLQHPRPLDATLTVTRAADLLGVHANTVRAWSDAGRLRYYRINPRGDRRYRLSDLQRFLATLGPAAQPAGHPEARHTLGRPRPGTVALDDHHATLALLGQLSAI